MSKSVNTYFFNFQINVNCYISLTEPLSIQPVLTSYLAHVSVLITQFEQWLLTLIIMIVTCSFHFYPRPQVIK